MGSDKEYLMYLCNGLRINADKNEYSSASAHKYYFVHPLNTGYFL